MNDLISRNKLIEHLNVCLSESDGRTPITDAVLMAIKCAAEQMPTIDAVEVVRCGDCKHQTKTWHEDKRMKKGGYWIYACAENQDNFVHHVVDGYDNDFCSYGKRKEVSE